MALGAAAEPADVAKRAFVTQQWRRRTGRAVRAAWTREARHLAALVGERSRVAWLTQGLAHAWLRRTGAAWRRHNRCCGACVAVRACGAVGLREKAGGVAVAAPFTRRRLGADATRDTKVAIRARARACLVFEARFTAVPPGGTVGRLRHARDTEASADAWLRLSLRQAASAPAACWAGVACLERRIEVASGNACCRDHRDGALFARVAGIARLTRRCALARLVLAELTGRAHLAAGHIGKRATAAIARLRSWRPASAPAAGLAVDACVRGIVVERAR